MTATTQRGGIGVYSVRQYRTFTCGGFAWTIWLELHGHRLDGNGELAGDVWRRFWQWITDRVTPVPDNDSVVMTPTLPRTAADPPTLGDLVEMNPDAYTPERLAALVFDGIAETGYRVESVTVLRQKLSGHADHTVEATVRASSLIETREVVDMLRRLCTLNGLTLSQSDAAKLGVDRHAGSGRALPDRRPTDGGSQD